MQTDATGSRKKRLPLLWEQRVACSNHAAPTTYLPKIKTLAGRSPTTPEVWNSHCSTSNASFHTGARSGIVALRETRCTIGGSGLAFMSVEGEQ